MGGVEVRGEEKNLLHRFVLRTGAKDPARIGANTAAGPLDVLASRTGANDSLAPVHAKSGANTVWSKKTKDLFSTSGLQCKPY